MRKIIWIFLMGIPAFTALQAQNRVNSNKTKQINSEIMENQKSTTTFPVTPGLQNKIRIAYIDEPPFYWTDENGKVKGADIELAEVILQAIGITNIVYEHTTFEQLLPGVQTGRWDMNVPIFVTPERSEDVAFSIPVWALGDGFVVLQGNPKQLTDYKAVALRADARLGIIPGQVQLQRAKAAGVTDHQIIFLKDQHEAVEALLSGRIDAFAATALGNHSIAQANPGLESVAHKIGKDEKVTVGGFSFSKNNPELLKAVNEQLHQFLGTPEHREKMAKYGITATEIDEVADAK
ncbi:transporter substrate-binding domain-containing protein [Chryseobacterium sp.]|uniref:transporter substrate-binding domain-containing protein n=1 Tax=Chryseobacterium sp. TaxID=1871047 RepID=UPI0025BD6BD2|nr:transporter substrate-binding domain-containing protein [Chryseobacterium sp.]MBV8325033.1 transporter substrate-binding domain-containing protein [Chryseobacterium sp.]